MLRRPSVGTGTVGESNVLLVVGVLPTAGLLARPAGLLARKKGEGHAVGLTVDGTLFFAPSPTV
jgi:hypothetical protein